MRTGGKKFDADACAFLGCVTEIDDAAFLLFIGRRIDEHDLGAEVDGFLEVKQAAVSVDDDCLAVLAELAPVRVFACRADGDAREHPRTPALLCVFRYHQNYRAMRGGGSQRRESACVLKKAVFKKLAEFA